MMRRGNRLEREASVLVIVAMLVMLGSPARAQVGACALDQSQTSFGGRGGGFTFIASDFLEAQTFTAGTSGTLCQVSLHGGPAPGLDCDGKWVTPGDLVVQIRTTTFEIVDVFGGNFGQTTAWAPSETILASQTLSPATMQQGDDWVDVVFDVPPSVTAGERYAIVLSTSNLPLDDPCGWALEPGWAWTVARGPSGQDLYPGGQNFGRGPEWPRWSVSELPSYPTFDELLFAVHATPTPVCGNGIVEAAEGCDGGSGNGVDGCCTTACTPLDRDGDGACDQNDACANDPENDADGDGVCGDVDGCPHAADADQADRDGDLVGDVCDADDAPLDVRSARVRAGIDPAVPKSTMLVKAHVVLAPGDVFDAQAGLALRVTDGVAIDEAVDWAASDCLTTARGGAQCITPDRRQRAQVKPIPSQGLLRVTLKLTGLAFVPPLGSQLAVTLTTDPAIPVSGIDRAGVIQACEVAGGDMRCRAR